MSDRPQVGAGAPVPRPGWARAAGRLGLVLLVATPLLLVHRSGPAGREVLGRWSRDYAAFTALVACAGVLLVGGMRRPGSAWATAAGASLSFAVQGAALGLFTFALVEGACRLAERPLSRVIGGLGGLPRDQGELNSHGLRDPERPFEKPAGTWRLLVVGDSFAYGNGLPSDSTVARRLERALARPGGPRVEVINAGLPGMNTVRERAVLDTLGLRFHPDLVLLQYVLNDPEPRNLGYPFLVPGPVAQALRWSVAYAATRAVAYRVQVALRLRPTWTDYIHGLFDPESEDWRRHVAALRGIVDDARAAGAPVMISVWPLPEPRRDLERYAFAAEQRRAVSAAAATGATVLDLLPVFARDRYADFALSDWDPHPNAAANRRAALAIRDAIESRGLGPRPQLPAAVRR